MSGFSFTKNGVTCWQPNVKPGEKMVAAGTVRINDVEQIQAPQLVTAPGQTTQSTAWVAAPGGI